MATPDTSGSLDDLLSAFDRDRSYTTQRLLKENELERTEVVVDPHGRRFIRKYIAVEPGQVHPYERLVGVKHPNLQRVCEATRLGDRLVVVCEYVEGLNLREFVASFGVMERDTACSRIRDVCAALSILHSMEGGAVVHRDVNPSNIVISNGRAVLIDLGIARNYRAQANADTHLWGTSGYTAPEQFGFRQTDARADVYAAGMCLRFMLTGADPADQAVSVPAWAADVIAAATDMDPADRLQSAAALVNMMSAAAAGTAPHGASAEHASTPHASTAPAQPMSAPAPPPTTESARHRLVGATKRSAELRAVWRIWQAFVALLFVGIVRVVPDAIGRAPAVGNAIGGMSGVIFAFLIPMALSTNFLNMNDRLPWLRKHRHRRLFLTMLASWAVFLLVLAFVHYSGMPYVYTSRS